MLVSSIFLEIPENSQESLVSFLDLQPFRESRWCSDLELLGIRSPVGY